MEKIELTVLVINDNPVIVSERLMDLIKHHEEYQIFDLKIKNLKNNHFGLSVRQDVIFDRYQYMILGYSFLQSDLFKLHQKFFRTQEQNNSGVEVYFQEDPSWETFDKDLLEIFYQKRVEVEKELIQLRDGGKLPSFEAKEKAEAERLAKEKAEAERLAREQAEAERLAREQAEAERIAKEQAEAERIAKEKAEAERLAKEKAEAERLAKEKAEAERIAKEKAEAERIAKEKAEAERLAKEKAEVERLAKEKAEAERLAKEKAEAERLAKEKAEAERIAREQAEAERLAKEKAEAERLAKEKAEAERIAKEKAEAERIAKEQAEAERLAKEKAEAERIAKEQAEAERLAKEQAEAEAEVKEEIDFANIKKEQIFAIFEEEKQTTKEVPARRIKQEKIQEEEVQKTPFSMSQEEILRIFNEDDQSEKVEERVEKDFSFKKRSFSLDKELDSLKEEDASFQVEENVEENPKQKKQRRNIFKKRKSIISQEDQEEEKKQEQAIEEDSVQEMEQKKPRKSIFKKRKSIISQEELDHEESRQEQSLEEETLEDLEEEKEKKKLSLPSLPKLSLPSLPNFTSKREGSLPQTEEDFSGDLGFFGNDRGVGTSFISYTMAKSLSRRKKVALIDMTGANYKKLLELKEKGVIKFEVFDRETYIDAYRKNLDIRIFDFGILDLDTQTFFAEFERCQRKYIVSSESDLKLFAINKNYQYVEKNKDVYSVFNFKEKEELPSLKKAHKELKVKVFPYVKNEDIEEEEVSSMLSL